MLVFAMFCCFWFLRRFSFYDFVASILVLRFSLVMVFHGSFTLCFDFGGCLFPGALAILWVDFASLGLRQKMLLEWMPRVVFV